MPTAADRKRVALAQQEKGRAAAPAEDVGPRLDRKEERFARPKVVRAHLLDARQRVHNSLLPAAAGGSEVMGW